MLTTKAKVAMTVIVIVAIGVASWRWRSVIFPDKPEATKKVDVKAVQQSIKDSVTAQTTTPATPVKAQAATAPAKTTAVPAGLLAGEKEVKVLAASMVPAVTGLSDYTKSQKNGKFVVKFPINVWPGWAGIIMANGGLEANDDSVFLKKHGFYLELSIVDDPVKARDLFAGGHSHILWGTLDMMALYAPELCKDSRTVPVIPQQIDFSSGGDGIVARNGVRSVNDLGVATANGKRKVVLAQNSTSQYFVMALLIEAGVDPSTIDWVWTADAPSAAKLYVQDKTYDAFVGWSPDIYIVTDQDKNSRLVVTSGQANRLVADVWAARNDFVKDHPEIIEGLVDGIFEGVEMVRRNPDKAAELMGKAYGLSLADCKQMIGKDGGVAEGDAHLTNYRENETFFLRPGVAYNFEVIWTRATKIYKALGYINEEVPASKVKYTTALVKLADAWKNSTDLSQKAFNFKDAFSKIEADEDQILVKRVVIQFKASKRDLDPTYDPNIPATLEEIGKLAGSFGAALISIEGNADASLKGTVPPDLVRQLSEDRAEAVKKALVDQYKFNPEQVRALGRGWDNPLPDCLDPTNPEHRKKNRRVEIRVFPLEQD